MRGREEDNKREREKKRIGKETREREREGGREAANGSFCDTTGRREGEGE